MLAPAPPAEFADRAFDAAEVFDADERTRAGGCEARLVRAAAPFPAAVPWLDAALWFAVALGGPVIAGALVEAWGLVVDLAPCARNGTIA